MSFSIKYFLIFIKARRIWTKKCTIFGGDTEVVGIYGFFLSQNEIEVYLIAFLSN